MKRQWFSLIALCALTACADDDRINAPPDEGSGGASSSGGSASSSGGSPSSGGASSGGSSSGGSSAGGSAAGGTSTDPDAGPDSGGPDGGGFVSQLPRPLELPRPPRGRLPADLFPPKI
jgi:hypothetical protein